MNSLCNFPHAFMYLSLCLVLLMAALLCVAAPSLTLAFYVCI